MMAGVLYLDKIRYYLRVRVGAYMGLIDFNGVDCKLIFPSTILCFRGVIMVIR